jgi:hypothetical protein
MVNGTWFFATLRNTCQALDMNEANEMDITVSGSQSTRIKLLGFRQYTSVRSHFREPATEKCASIDSRQQLSVCIIITCRRVET